MRGWLIILPSYALGLAPGLAVLLFARRRSRVRALPSTLLIVPVVVWGILSSLVGPGGTLANALLEPFYLGLTVSAIQGLRLIAPGTTEEQSRARFLISVVLSVVVTLVYVFAFPDLPE